MDHPSRDEVAALCRDSLPAKREREVLAHLLFDHCPDCRAAVAPPLSVMLGLEPARRRHTPEEEAACDAAIDRACVHPLALERHLREQRAEAERGLQLLRAGRKLPRGMTPLACMWAYLDRSWELRYDNPKAMSFCAWCAVQISLRLDPTFYGQEGTRDLQARAQADLSNSYRVENRFGDAERFLSNARRLFEEGTGDPELEMRLLDFEASLLADLRRFSLATPKLLKMLAYYEDRGDQHLVARTLVKLGIYAGYDGNHELAVRRLRQSLKLIDVERDPSLAYSAAHSLIFFLADSGRIAEAKKLCLVYSRHLKHAKGRIAKLKFRDLEGRIAAGEGNYRRAEDLFREVKAGMTEAGLPMLAGIAMLDLAAALLAQRKAREAERTVRQAAKLFVSLGCQRESLEAVILLRDAFRIQTVTVAMVKEVADFQRRRLTDLNLRFEAREWRDEE